MNFMKTNLEIKNKIFIFIYKINKYGSLNNNQQLLYFFIKILNYLKNFYY